MKPTYLNCLSLLGVGGAHPGGLKLTKDILLKEDIDKTIKVLDIGCGTGQTSAYIANQYECDVTAFDSNYVMLEKSRERFSELSLSIDIVYGYVENLPFENLLFDLILSESVLAFTNTSKSISEVKRVLKPCGVLLAIEMVCERELSNEARTEIQDFYEVSHLLSENDWITIFRANGFGQVNVEKVKLKNELNDLDNTAEFSLSENIPDDCFYILKKHEYFTDLYRDSLGFRIFRCNI
jgi:SAM-dependent methyltransferase